MNVTLPTLRIIVTLSDPRSRLHSAVPPDVVLLQSGADQRRRLLPQRTCEAHEENIK